MIFAVFFSVVTLVNEYQPAGNHSIQLSDFSAEHSNGVYFYTLKVSDFFKSNKMMLIKQKCSLQYYRFHDECRKLYFGYWIQKNEVNLLIVVSTNLKKDYDVAALVLYHNNGLWAKLCFENSADKEVMVVSVVTKKSDDCNPAKLSGNYIYLSAVKKGARDFHYLELENGTKYMQSIAIKLMVA